MLTLVYIVLGAIGGGYVVVSTLLGHMADAFDTGHAAGGHHGAADFHFPFFSPLAVATLFGALGAWGLIAKHGFRVGDGASLLLALPLAFVTTYAVTYAAWRLVMGSRGSSTIRLADLVGRAAEVLTPIPAGGAGEIAALVDGQRYTGPARHAEGQAVPRGALVTIVEVAGTTLLVTPRPGGAS